MNATLLRIILLLFFVNAFQSKNHLAQDEFVYNGKVINMRKDNLQILQKNFNNHFDIDHESDNVDPKNIIKYVNIKEKTLFTKETAITPALYFDFKKSRGIQKASLIFSFDNAFTDRDFKMAVRRISENLPLLNYYRYVNKQLLYYHGLKVEIYKRKFDDGYDIQVDIECCGL